mmetsp:Transcript_34352/g.96852  ORF Transcript_34352/g.96852 Transcript_34352/m.96852 type:complete len:264 (+) Transcript_34352:983-1774(+)
MEARSLALASCSFIASNSPTRRFTSALSSALPLSSFSAALAAFTFSPWAATAASRSPSWSGVSSGVFITSSTPESSVVTWNISPAPSQSEVVMMGVCTYRKPLDWKKSWVAQLRALRMRATALIVFVRGRRCSFSRRNSNVVRFFEMGYLAPSQAPTKSTSVTPTSTSCLAPSGAALSTPRHTTDVPDVVIAPRPPRGSAVSALTISCKFCGVLPSLSSRNANAPPPWTRPVFTQPPTTSCVPAPSLPRASTLAHTDRPVLRL